MPLLMPWTPADAPGLVGLTRPTTPAALADLESVSPRTPGLAPVVEVCWPTRPVPFLVDRPWAPMLVEGPLAVARIVVPAAWMTSSLAVGDAIPIPTSPAGVIRIRSSGVLLTAAVLKMSGATLRVPR